MLTVSIGAVQNIRLDPLFIFVLNMGISGAALATVLRQMVSAFWAMGFLMSSRAILDLRQENMVLDWTVLRRRASSWPWKGQAGRHLLHPPEGDRGHAPDFPLAPHYPLGGLRRLLGRARLQPHRWRRQLLHHVLYGLPPAAGFRDRPRVSLPAEKQGAGPV